MKNRTAVIPNNHEQYLIAVTMRSGSNNERSIYRVPLEATLVSVVRTAKDRSELVGDVHCISLEILGTIEPHLRPLYVPLLSEQDVTDMVGP
jgi:hypothetical protein